MQLRSAVLALTLGVFTMTCYRTSSSSAQLAPKKIEVVAKRFEYQPGEITLKKGEPVVIALRSEDVAHGIHFKELNLQAKIDKGGTGQLAFTPDKTGTFVGHCSVFCGSGHGGMTLTIHVVE
jgi:cytochrome c oxidase subunit 2